MIANVMKMHKKRSSLRNHIRVKTFGWRCCATIEYVTRQKENKRCFRRIKTNNFRLNFPFPPAGATQSCSIFSSHQLEPGGFGHLCRPFVIGHTKHVFVHNYVINKSLRDRRTKYTNKRRACCHVGCAT